MKRSRGAVFQAAAPKPSRARIGCSEVESAEQGACIPDSGGLPLHSTNGGWGGNGPDAGRTARARVLGQQRLWCHLDWARASLRVARGRQLQQSLPMHAQPLPPGIRPPSGLNQPKSWQRGWAREQQSPHLPAAKSRPQKRFSQQAAAGVLAQVNARARWGLISPGEENPPVAAVRTCLAQASIVGHLGASVQAGR